MSHEVLIQAMISALVCIILRPLTIMSIPTKKNKQDNQYASAHSISSGVVGIIASLLITSLASLYINSNYKKYKKVATKGNLSGYDVARKVLDANGLNDVLVLETQGELTDHYDSDRRKKT